MRKQRKKRPIIMDHPLEEIENKPGLIYLDKGNGFMEVILPERNNFSEKMENTFKQPPLASVLNYRALRAMLPEIKD